MPTLKLALPVLGLITDAQKALLTAQNEQYVKDAWRNRATRQRGTKRLGDLPQFYTFLVRKGTHRCIERFLVPFGYRLKAPPKPTEYRSRAIVYQFPCFGVKFKRSGGNAEVSVFNKFNDCLCALF